MQILVGGILFGFGSIFEPVVVYNLSANAIQEINIFAYLGIQTLTQLPIIILLATLAFAISTIFSNSALAITISLLGYMGASIINQLAIAYKLTFMKYFVTMNWGFKPVLIRRTTIYGRNEFNNIYNYMCSISTNNVNTKHL